jgi:non-specific serine/threonine protein kinase
MDGAVASFSELLRRHRLAAGLTQEALAEQAGLSVTGVQKLERGESHPYRDTAQRLTQALRLAAEDEIAFRNAAQPVPRRPKPPAENRSPRHNLPVPLTSFVGRQREVAEVTQRLRAARVLTLTGVGGCGKTRLAMEVGRQVVERYPDGVWLVELGPLADPSLVPQTVAAALDLRETGEQSITSTLGTALRARHLLLVLDNCEHLLDACTQLVDALLRACPDVQVLATSREPLGLTGEVAWRVPSLPVPDLQQLPPLAELQHQPAVQLFVERAAAALPQFGLSPANAPVVAQVCQRLDGIPLALELAAARVQALAVGDLAARLDQRFRLLTGGSQAALPRQQTLRATLDWSYDLLSEPERRVFNRLSVFAGGWSLAAAEVVCAGNGIDADDVLELLARLVQKSLVGVEEGTSGVERYRLLETVRQYGRERLVGAGEAEAVHAGHARYYLALAEGVELQSWGTSQPAWLRGLAAEHDNLRAALVWFIETNTAEQAVRLGGVLYPVWLSGGYLSEGRAQVEKVLVMPGAAGPSAARAQLLTSAAIVATSCGDYEAGRGRLAQSVALWRTLGDRSHLATALFFLGVAAREEEDYDQARACLEECLVLARELEASTGIARTLDSLGTIAHALGDYELARARYEASLALARQTDDRWEQAWSLHNLGCLAIDLGDYRAARARLVAGLALRGDYDKAGLAHGLAEMASVAAAEGSSDRALRLAGATGGLTQKTGIRIMHSERGRFECWLATAREALGPVSAALAWEEGQAMSLNEARAYALEAAADEDAPHLA